MKIEFKFKVVIVKVEKAIKTTGYQKTVLNNGVRVVTEYLPYSESYALGICVKAGARDDFENLPGITHFLEHIIFKGSQKLSARKIATSFESLGAYTNAFTTQENTLFYVRALNTHFQKTFSMLTDIVLNPLIKPKDVEREKTVIIEEIKSYEDDPEELIFDYADNILFGSHPLGNQIVGTIESVQRITDNDLKLYHKTFFAPDNMIIIASGSLDHSKIVQLAEKYCQFNDTYFNRPERTIPPILKSSSRIEKKQIQQTHLLLAKRIEGIKSPERYPMAVLNVLFGDGMSSRLYQNIREKSGIAYTVYSTIQLFEDCGGFYIYSATDKKNEKLLKQSLMKEIAAISQNKVKLSEFKRAKEQLKSSVIMELESKSARIQSMVKNEFQLGLYEDSISTIKSIDAVTIEDLNFIINKYFNLEDWNYIAIKP